jgi:hypothetical protein
MERDKGVQAVVPRVRVEVGAGDPNGIEQDGEFSFARGEQLGAMESRLGAAQQVA